MDLVQDVNTLRPLMALARRDTAAELCVLVSANFQKFDSTGLWIAELREACGILGIPVYSYSSEFEAFQVLQERSGLLISGSESDARAHAGSHALFQAAPAKFVRVTLQHGFECLGFLHNAAHDRSHGLGAAFNADIICGWFGENLLRSVKSGERSKLIVTGPPLLIDTASIYAPPAPTETPDGAVINGVEPHVEAERDPQTKPACLICENLHSVRLGNAVLRSDFISQFSDFAAAAAQSGLEVWLRPHPAGRYTDVKGIALPGGVQKSNGPIYKEDLRRFTFAISAPSSILFDCIVAGIPVAVWQDAEGEVDCRNYPGLPVVTSVEEWLEFAALAEADRAGLLTAQRRFVDGLMLPEDIEARYRDLLRSLG